MPFSSSTLPSNYSQLAAQLPTSVTALVLNLSTTSSDILPNNIFSTSSSSSFKPGICNKVDSDDLESPASLPMSPIHSFHTSKDTSSDDNNSIKSLENIDGPQSPDDLDIRSLEANSAEDDLEDTDIRCIPSEQQQSPSNSNDDIDIRFNHSTDDNILCNESLKPKSSIVDVNDVHALMNSLKKSGIDSMDSANLARILNKASFR